MILELKGELCVTQATEVKASLLSALEKGETLHLDLRGVTEIDAAGLQLLLATKVAAQGRGQGFSLPLDLRSAAVARAVALAGLTDALPGEVAHG
jgi:anti-sigma B factor antagonist